MYVIFKDITVSPYTAKVKNVEEKNGPYGKYIVITFEVTAGELKNYEFKGSVKFRDLKNSRLYRWVETILNKEPTNHFFLYELLSKSCLIYIEKTKHFYKVKEVSKLICI
jgi:hypothetical protein